jgi:phosphoglucosamine mutase
VPFCRHARSEAKGRHIARQPTETPVGSRPVARQYFGTDGVRGIVGEFITVELVEKLGKASALWSGGGRVFVGRDTRGSGEELEEAFARGVVSAGGAAVLAGVVPTPAVALLRLDLGVVISASHNPPEYNGVKFFDRTGRKLTDVAEEEIEALLDAPAPGGGEIDRVDIAADSYLEHVLERFGSDLTGLRIAVDCANGAYAGLAPGAFEQLGAEVEAIGNRPNGSNINVGCGATDLAALQELVVRGGFDLGVAFDGDGDRMLAVDERGETLDGDEIVAILALHLGVDVVAVTTMTNLGFHRLMDDRGIRVVTTDVGDRYVLEALYRENGVLGGEQSGHIICLRDHVTGDGLASALLLCSAVKGGTLSDAARVMERYPQVKLNLPRAGRGPLPPALLDRLAEVNDELDGDGRVLVRPSGTEPVVRVLAEAPTEAEAEALCARIAMLVKQELG